MKYTTRTLLLIFGILSSSRIATALSLKTDILFGVGIGTPTKGISEFARNANLKFANDTGTDVIPRERVGKLDVMGLDVEIGTRCLFQVIDQYLWTGVGVKYRIFNGGYETKEIEKKNLTDIPSTWMIHRAEIGFPIGSKFYGGFWVILSPKVAFNIGGMFKRDGEKNEDSAKALNIFDCGVDLEMAYEYYGVRIGVLFDYCFLPFMKKPASGLKFLDYEYSNDKERIGMIAGIKLILGVDPIQMMGD